MRIFLSYGSDDLEIAREVAAALHASGQRVFFDRTQLPPGGEFHAEILRQLRRSNAIIFLLSPSTLQPGRYPLSEIELAERRWPNPKNRVFSVFVRPVEMTSVPGYLRAVTIIKPTGPIAASIVQAIQNLQRYRAKHWCIATIILIILAGLVMLGAGLIWPNLPVQTIFNGGLGVLAPQSEQAINIDDSNFWHTNSQKPYPVKPPITLIWGKAETKKITINVDGQDFTTFENADVKSGQMIDRGALRHNEQRRFRVKIYSPANSNPYIVNKLAFA